MEKRIALIKDDVVVNIVIGTSEQEMATLFDCVAKEITENTGQAYIGLGFANGVFEQAPYVHPEGNEEVE
jgi:hypothetical protein